MKRTLNGITCEIASNGASRWARFTVDGWEYCKVSQNADAVNLTMASCRFHWSCSNPGGDTIIAVNDWQQFTNARNRRLPDRWLRVHRRERCRRNIRRG